MEFSVENPPIAPESWKFDAGTFALANEDHPKVNIDSCFSLPERGAFGVLDGTGMKPSVSVVAAVSEMARDYIAEKMSEWTENLSPEETASRIKAVILEAHGVIKKKAEEIPDFKKASTAASIVKFCKDTSGNKKVVIGHLGNARVYILRSTGVLEQVTLDQDRLNEYLRRSRGKTDEEIRGIQARYSKCTDLNQLSEEERDLQINVKEYRNTISSEEYRNKIGAPRCEPNIYTTDFNSGDVLVIVSDGIFNNLVDPKIVEILSNKKSSQEQSEELVITSFNIAHDGKDKNFRAEKDDMTAVVAK